LKPGGNQVIHFTYPAFGAYKTTLNNSGLWSRLYRQKTEPLTKAMESPCFWLSCFSTPFHLI